MLFIRVFTAFLFLFAGCAKQTKDLPNSLRISFASDPITVDPKKSGDFTSSTLICLIYEGLTRSKGGSEVELALAKSIAISEDGKKYLFSLRKSYWSDGEPVTAHDFEKSWKQILEPGFPSLCAYLLYPIKNAESYARGLCSAEEVGVHAIDSETLQVELENATPYFLSLTAFPLYLPSPSHVEVTPPFWAQNPDANFVCNGPFCIEKVDLGSDIWLKKNDSFWNPSSVKLDMIHISIISDSMTALRLFEKGELDIVGGPLTPITNETLPFIQKDLPLQFLPMAASTFCTMNTATFPFYNDSLRKAFALATQNHEFIMGEVKQAGQIPAQGVLPPSLEPVPDDSPLEKNRPEEARAYLKASLDELRITNADLEGIVLYYKASALEKRIAQTLQKVWMETLGIHVHIEQMDPKSLLQKLHAKKYQIALTSWIAQYHDAINILERFKDYSNPKNYPGWDLDEYREVLYKAVTTQSVEQRAQYLQSAVDILEENTVIIPLYHWSSPILVHPRVRELATTDNGGILIERCSLGDCR